MMDPAIVAALVQAGPAGLVVVLLLWIVRDLIPKLHAMMAEQRTELIALVTAERDGRKAERAALEKIIADERAECQREREDMQALMREEREASARERDQDRKHRHEMANVIQRLIAAIDERGISVDNNTPPSSPPPQLPPPRNPPRPGGGRRG